MAEANFAWAATQKMMHVHQSAKGAVNIIQIAMEVFIIVRDGRVAKGISWLGF